ncbi:TIGR02206 family membrane protein [Metabacillus herbersteinensis]|uniref:TIGR02206 family membrane protein n=1 Tax=Metabacillus herbersteinensis TaxID=283816 RepID=A0ABV6GMT6_9BACI
MNNYSEQFALFSPSHLFMLGLTVGTILLLFKMRKMFVQYNKHDHIRMFIVIGLFLSEAFLHIWYLREGTWDAQFMLPLQLCSISLILSIVMLLSRNYFLFEVTFFLGIGGATQALLTPELIYDFPHFRYFHFFLAHILIVIASVYMVIYEGFKPTLRSVWRAILALNILATFVFLMNRMTGGNYMFLSRKPSNPSLLDLLGDYPWYILSLEFVALFIFLLLYLPFYIFSLRTKPKAP